MAAEQPIPSDAIDEPSAPFEGPEKLLEIWFAPAPPTDPETGKKDAQGGLRKIPQSDWEEMLDIVKCKVLSAINGADVDAYLLSESSFFVFPHKLILKTCGTTLNLLGLPRILALAREHCGYLSVWRCFYSRKSFMFPERQLGPHKDWTHEIKFLDGLFGSDCPGAGYTVGKVNGDHWLLYLTSPEGEIADEDDEDGADAVAAAPASPGAPLEQDYTLEILMSNLAAPAREPFFFPPNLDSSDPSVPHTHGAALSAQLGIASLFPADRTTLDSFAFEPCGYSANALVRLDDGGDGEGYYTIHVTPEEGWSYASFECNVPLRILRSAAHDDSADALPDLNALIQRVIKIFQPGNLSITLFVSAPTDDTAAESAQRTFHHAIVPSGYKRTDKINYEFGEYELAFASFEKKASAKTK